MRLQKIYRPEVWCKVVWEEGCICEVNIGSRCIQAWTKDILWDEDVEKPYMVGKFVQESTDDKILVVLPEEKIIQVQREDLRYEIVMVD